MPNNSDHLLFYLLGSMRNEHLVEQALAQLGATRAEIASSRTKLVNHGLERLGATLGEFERLLGPPWDRVDVAASSEYERKRIRYLFELWPDLAVVISGSDAGVVSGISFERLQPGRNPPPIRLLELVPWQCVKSDLDMLSCYTSIRDEWYPVLDVETTTDAGKTRALLQFDFNLLQHVHAVESA